MKKPDKYADTIFAFGHSALYNVSVRIISDIYDEPQVYYLGCTEPTYVIMVCVLPSAEHYYTSGEIAPPITEEHAPLSATQQDMATSVVSELTETSHIDTNTLKHRVNTTMLELYIHNVPEHPTATINIVGPTRNGEATNNCLQSVPKLQVQEAVVFPCFQIRASEHTGPREVPNLNPVTPRGLSAEIPINQQRIFSQQILFDC